VARFRQRMNQRPSPIRGRGVENEHMHGAHERSLAAALRRAVAAGRNSGCQIGS
jgi:hypothetical protein